MYKTSGQAREAVEAYLSGEMTPRQTGIMRMYLKQWIVAFKGADELKERVADLDTRAKISKWLDDALELGIDPL
jgi:hypothetical protein